MTVKVTVPKALSLSGVMMERKHSQDITEFRKQEEKWGKQLLIASVGLFLCITASLTMITSLSNFILVYQTRNMLVEMTIAKTQEQTSTQQSTLTFSYFTETPIISSGTSSEQVTNITQWASTTIVHTTDYKSSTETTTEGTLPSNFTNSIPPTTNIYSTSSEPTKKENPISVLNREHSNKASYACRKECNSPSIITGQLNLTLSSNRKGDNYLLVTIRVCTLDDLVAKRRVAYHALQLLHEDLLNEVDVDEDWSAVCSECESEGDFTWSNCKN